VGLTGITVSHGADGATAAAHDAQDLSHFITRAVVVNEGSAAGAPGGAGGAGAMPPAVAPVLTEEDAKFLRGGKRTV
jgi:hypothetical protein